MRSPNDKWDLPFQTTSKKRVAAVFALEAGRDLTRDEIARYADIPKPTVTAVMQELAEKAGFDVERTLGKNNAAVYRISGGPKPSGPAERRGLRSVHAPRTAAETSVEGAGIALALADRGTVAFKGLSDGQIELSWSLAPGVLFTGKVGDAVPTALLTGEAPVVGFILHPAGIVELDLGPLRVRGRV